MGVIVPAGEPAAASTVEGYDPKTARPLFRRRLRPAGRQGLRHRRRRRPDHLGAHRLADVDDLRPGLLRRRDDAGRRCRATTWSASASRPRASPRQSRRDDRRRHPDQQDGSGAAQGLRPDAGAALRDLHGQLRQRRRLLPLSAIRSCAAATASCRWTSTSPAARPPPRRWSTASCSCRRRSAAPGPSSDELAASGRRRR